MMFAGQVMVGSLLVTTTSKLWVVLKPDLSVAVHDTEDVPMGKEEEPTAGMDAPLHAHSSDSNTQLSVAVTSKATEAEDAHVAVAARLVGQLNTGASLSSTSYVNEQVAALFEESVALQTTLWLAAPCEVNEEGVQEAVTAAPVQVSMAVAVKACSAGQVAAG
jgi:hypothetical protein